MAQPSFFDNVRSFIGGVAFAVYLWSVRMTKEQFWTAQDKQAVEQIFAVDGACALCGGEVVDPIPGFCKSCRVQNPPRH